MKKTKKYQPTGFIVGVMKQGGEAEYTVNGVRYLVSSCFLPPTTRTWENPTIKDRLEAVVKSDLSPLTLARTNGTVSSETVCSADKERPEQGVSHNHTLSGSGPRFAAGKSPN